MPAAHGGRPDSSLENEAAAEAAHKRDCKKILSYQAATNEGLKFFCKIILYILGLLMSVSIIVKS